MKKLLLSFSAILLLSVVQAQNPGDLDPNFGIGGYTITDPFNNTGELYWNLITLSDDKIVKVGLTNDGGDKNILISKFLADGTPDNTFGVNGFAVIDLSLGGDEEARGVFELSNGNLLVTGYVEGPGGYNGFVMRLNADGTMDNTFGTNSGYTTFNTGDNFAAYGKDVVEMGGEIYVGGSALVMGQADICVFNFTLAGILDVSFASSGVGRMDINGDEDIVTSMAVTPGGAFIFGGYSELGGDRLGFVASLSQFGTPTTFGTGGSYTFDLGSGTNEVNDVIVDSAGDIVIAGNEGVFPNVNGFLMRLDNSGAIDNTFATNGIAMSDPGMTTALFLRSVNETADNGYVAVGNFDGASKQIYALLVTSTGSFNSDFGGNGDVIIPFSITVNTAIVVGGALQSDGSIIIGGYLTSQDFVGENMFMVKLFPYVDNSSLPEIIQESISVYPNPTNGQFKIDLENIKRVQLVSVEGKTIATWEGKNSYEVPQNATPGVYILHVETDITYGVTRLLIK